MIHMEKISKLSEKIKTLKEARSILHEEYTQSDFHKKKEAHPHETVPSSPEDEERSISLQVKARF